MDVNISEQNKTLPQLVNNLLMKIEKNKRNRIICYKNEKNIGIQNITKYNKIYHFLHKFLIQCT